MGRRARGTLTDGPLTGTDAGARRSILRAILIEEQKIVKRVLKTAKKDAPA